LRQDNRTN